MLLYFLEFPIIFMLTTEREKMEKVTFEKFVSVDVLNEKLGMENDWFEGEGVYEFKFGCRGESEGIVKVSSDNSFMMKNKEEIVKLMREDWLKGGELEGWEEEYWDEFCYSERGDREELEIYWESYGEEDWSEFYWVKK